MNSQISQKSKSVKHHIWAKNIYNRVNTKDVFGKNKLAYKLVCVWMDHKLAY